MTDSPAPSKPGRPHRHDSASRLKALKACQDALRPLDRASRMAVCAGLRTFVTASDAQALPVEAEIDDAETDKLILEVRRDR